MNHGLLAMALLSLTLAACQAPTPQQPLAGHISTETSIPQVRGDIPATVQQTMAVPKPRNTPKAETYSVSVHNVPVNSLLFALARDAKVNIDIHPSITGNVSLNAFNQTLQQLLARIAKQVDMRYELDGPNIVVIPDLAYLKNYKVDYVNMARTVTGKVSANTLISTGVPSSGTGVAPTQGSASGNASLTEITNSSKNQFWETLDKNIKDILREDDKVLWEKSCTEDSVGQRTNIASTEVASTGSGVAAGAGGLAIAGKGNQSASGQGSQNPDSRASRQQACGTFKEAASVIVNAESGVISIRATSRQHEKIQEFIDRVITSSRRQVLIEATIVEVQLGEGYQQGINWSSIQSGFSITQAGVNSNVGTALKPFAMTYSSAGGITAAVNLLQSFGTLKVLSSPRLSVMNNQTAVLKAVENYTFFLVQQQQSAGNANTNSQTATTTTPQVVPVGLVMTVTPQVSGNNAVILNVRPSISSISELKEDPNPALREKLPYVPNYVPQIRTREIESVMRVNSGEIAVLGGLMTDTIDWKDGRVPILGQLPLVGELFNTRNNSAIKSELVIFLRPVIIMDPSLDGDYAGYRSQLPGEDFFRQTPEAQLFNVSPNPQ